MNKREWLLIFVVAITSNKLSWEMGSKSGAARESLRILTQKYISDSMLVDVQKKEIDLAREQLSFMKQKKQKEPPHAAR